MLLKLGEIVLKGKNRQHFERLLQENIRRAARDLGIPIRIGQREGVIVLRLAGAQDGDVAAEAAADQLAERMRDDGPVAGMPCGAGGQGPRGGRSRRPSS